ncbi:hypothetical protein HX13_01180 [Chryseobacterium sp. P1-3]|uniref:hypothetical protein n=1 Tax=Chryseobacterium sp. (strain P1-3) TaxID=1517683 RepID=UPI0004E67FAF|nr:hypothetical protein [Chryseobacterium sp. P1-3]KFF75997.1 hypothetical protein HX13_01180 [Chryseobacterium sp. P1-3]
MFFGTNTAHRIKTALDLYGIGCYSPIGKFLLFFLKLSALIIPVIFAYSRFEEFEFGLWNILKFIGWFLLAHLIYENFVVNFIAGILIRKKQGKSH